MFVTFYTHKEIFCATSAVVLISPFFSLEHAYLNERNLNYYNAVEKNTNPFK
jgi:hypothetical protein